MVHGSRKLVNPLLGISEGEKHASLKSMMNHISILINFLQHIVPANVAMHDVQAVKGRRKHNTLE